MSRKSINVFIFRRDLRIIDNIALSLLVKQKLPILPIFIFNPVQIKPDKNPYFSVNAYIFMIECLLDLKLETKDSLQFFYDKDITVLNQILMEYDINTIAFNTDYTPFARNRDSEIKVWCEKNKISCLTAEDYSLYSMGSILSKSQLPYTIFTPFYNNCMSVTVPKPNKISPKINYLISKKLKTIKNITNLIQLPEPLKERILGGRDNAIIRLNEVKIGKFKKYKKQRDFMLHENTHLSAYIKFGCISIREVYWTFKSNKELLRQLIWREFYAHIVWHFPKVLNSYTFKDKYNDINYNKPDEKWHKFMKGQTGFPLVDSAVRQIMTTGYMQNRLRMIVCNFITHDLFLDWRIAERWFATHLIDYDPASNSGGNQSCASVGVDAQPWFRTMNPFVQSLRFDPKCIFIYKMIPELNNVPVEDIHNWQEAYKKYSNIKYPAPIVNHKEMIHIFEEKFKKI